MRTSFFGRAMTNRPGRWRALKRSGALTFVAAVASLLLPGTAGAVANGADVPDGQYQFSVALTMKGITRPDGTKYNSACSGALIAPQWIATAGHCFHDGNRVRVSGKPRYDSTIATVGRATLDGTGGHDIEVVWVEQAPDQANDVAIAKLARPVKDVRPLSVSSTPAGVGTKVRMTGFGAAKAWVSGPHDRLNRLQTGLWEVQQVQERTLLAKAVAPQSTTSACPYDSGAPYFVPDWEGYRLVGVESDGPDCPHDQLETVARIDHLSSWIAQTIH
ncbi:esterase [Longimycelium tulufanense]|uniref:Esterase n=1 Tax=Longimycelium tulufanense TaxID=907463 RepID=A0A8J3FVC4_9PSEU|nr:S1 family peptidase [Longimycelium tulufanense]GGM50636.1 esterase [Longimycelium tulufanense]